jgi:hypothetical protein
VVVHRRELLVTLLVPIPALHCPPKRAATMPQLREVVAGELVAVGAEVAAVA